MPHRLPILTREQFLAHVEQIPEQPGCWLWMAGRGTDGYGHVWNAVTRHQEPAHRMSYRLQCGPIPRGLKVLHRCDVRACVRPDHLFLGSQRDNIRDAVQKGRWPIREAHHSAKLTVELVRDIREQYRPRLGYQLSRRYGVDPSTLMAIVHGETWRGV